MALPQIPKPPQPQPQPANDINQMRQKFFSGAREDLNRNRIAQQQEADDAIQRRMTSIGQANSGAAMGAQLKARESVANQNNSAMNQLAGQEAEVAQAGMVADRDENFRQNAFNVGNDFKTQEMQMAKDQFDRQFELDKETTMFNRMLAENEMNRKSPSLLRRLGLNNTAVGKIFSDDK